MRLNLSLEAELDVIYTFTQRTNTGLDVRVRREIIFADNDASLSNSPRRRSESNYSIEVSRYSDTSANISTDSHRDTTRGNKATVTTRASTT
jgi:hypothetical protein